MNIPPFWIREKRPMGRCDGKPSRVSGTSFESMAAARAAMEQMADLLRRCYERGDFRPMAELRETYAAVYEVTEERWDEQNIVTRNRSGALVLNTTDVCFIDVDRVRGGFLNTLASLFGRGKTEEQILLERVRALCAADESLGFRVYRTAKGFRVIAAGKGVYLGSARMMELFEALDADPLYTKLCEKQDCWRARLTPKPSRIGVKDCPLCTDSESAPAVIAAWRPAYDEAAAGYCVCRLRETVGRAINHPTVIRHDELTGARLNGREPA